MFLMFRFIQMISFLLRWLVFYKKLYFYVLWSFIRICSFGIQRRAIGMKLSTSTCLMTIKKIRNNIKIRRVWPVTECRIQIHKIKFLLKSRKYQVAKSQSEIDYRETPNWLGIRNRPNFRIIIPEEIRMRFLRTSWANEISRWIWKPSKMIWYALDTNRRERMWDFFRTGLKMPVHAMLFLVFEDDIFPGS